MRRWLAAIFALALMSWSACATTKTNDKVTGGGTKTTEADIPTEDTAGGGPDGATKETARQLCSGKTSYQYVADHTCPDGSQPLKGNIYAGRRARARNVGPGPDGHIVDLYEVKCPSGVIEIYIDLYHCPSGRRPF